MHPLKLKMHPFRKEPFDCIIFILQLDPPYNTGSAFEHYDDNFEHSSWLNLMNERLQILRTLLSTDGFIFVQIDNY